jgi:hypothetical protein
MAAKLERTLRQITKDSYYWDNREAILLKAKTRYWSDEHVRTRAIKNSKTQNELTARYLKKYGMTLDDYNQMFARQHGQCAICDVSVQDERMCVDHDHATGNVRGLLCRLCNSSLGGFRDSVDLLRKAVAYLEDK